jgi:hypothetical protein
MGFVNIESNLYGKRDFVLLSSCRYLLGKLERNVILEDDIEESEDIFSSIEEILEDGKTIRGTIESDRYTYHWEYIDDDTF